MPSLSTDGWREKSNPSERFDSREFGHPRRHLYTTVLRIYIVERINQRRGRDMKVAFQKWGNSLALRVPKAVAQEIGASDGKAAEMSVRDGKLVIEVTKPKRRKRRFTLDELVAGITPENRHEEIDRGPPVGNEVW